MVTAHLHYTESLKYVSDGANLVTSVTNFWTPCPEPENRARAKEQGKLIARYAYELELVQGKNQVWNNVERGNEL